MSSSSYRSSLATTPAHQGPSLNDNRIADGSSHQPGHLHCSVSRPELSATLQDTRRGHTPCEPPLLEALYEDVWNEGRVIPMLHQTRDNT